MSSIEPHLPPDLERAIFELAARTFRRRIPRFMLVAYRVYLWLQPILYSRFYDIRRVLDEDLALRVRSIMIPPEVYTSAVNHAALALCTRTTHLALCPRVCDAKMLPVLAAMPSLRVLVFAPDKVFPVEPDAAVAAAVQYLSGITHLELLTLPEARQDDFLSILRALPRLTHLALNRLPPLAWIRSLLAGCANLDALVILSFRQLFLRRRIGKLRERLREEDCISGVEEKIYSKLVLTMYRHWAECIRDDGRSYWDGVDIFLERKRRGLVQEDIYHTDTVAM